MTAFVNRVLYRASERIGSNTVMSRRLTRVPTDAKVLGDISITQLKIIKALFNEPRDQSPIAALTPYATYVIVTYRQPVEGPIDGYAPHQRTLEVIAGVLGPNVRITAELP